MKPKVLPAFPSSVLKLEVCTAAVSFLCGLWKSNSGLHAHGSSTFRTEPALWPSSSAVFTGTSSYMFTQESPRNKLPSATIVRLTFAFPPGLLWSLSAQLKSSLPYPSGVEACPDVNTVCLRG